MFSNREKSFIKVVFSGCVINCLSYDALVFGYLRYFGIFILGLLVSILLTVQVISWTVFIRAGLSSQRWKCFNASDRYCQVHFWKGLSS